MASFLIESIIALVLISSILEAKDFGSRGHTFEIAEDDFQIYMKERIASLNETEMKNVQQMVKNNYLSLFNEPKRVEGLVNANQYRVSYFDPTISVDQDIKNHEGKLIVAKGEKVNPLHIVALQDDLLFFDGGNIDHIEWAKTQKSDSRWVLTKGRPLDLEEIEMRPVYFDQLGILTKKLGIKAIPAKVSQEGELLKIEEFSIEGRS